MLHPPNRTEAAATVPFLKPFQGCSATVVRHCENTRPKMLHKCSATAVARHPWCSVWATKCLSLLAYPLLRHSEEREKRAFLSLLFSLRDAEMTIKIIFERLSQKGGSAGGSKRGSTGDPSWNFIVGLKHRKNSILENRILLSSLFSRKYSDNNFGQLPPPPPSRGSD